jgi:DNA-binding GntR family transcriptional regulator
MQASAEARERLRQPTVSSVIRQDLRRRILSLDLLPGQPLVEKEIAEAFGVSRTPVREAVLRLAEEGLIDVFPQSGTFVARIPFHALPEAIIVRRSLEETSARLAAANADAEDLAMIRAKVAHLRAAVDAGDKDEFHKFDEEFHAAIADAAGYPGLWRMAQQVKAQVDRFRRLTLPQEGRLERVQLEHEAVADAIASGDGDVASRHMSIHLDALLSDLADVAGLNPDYFDFGTAGSQPYRSAAPHDDQLEIR